MAANTYLPIFLSFFTRLLQCQTQFFPINWTLAANATSIETKLYSSAYIPLAPCSCDLFRISCDPACCCDPDCDEIQSKSLNCSAADQIFDTQKPQYATDCYFLFGYRLFFLCLEWPNSPFLGKFFDYVPIARSGPEFAQKISESKPAEKFSDYFKAPAFIQNPSSLGYAMGSYLPLGAMDSFLSIPQPILNGFCAWAPIRFLRPTTHSCFINVTSEACAGLPDLRAAIFAAEKNQIRQRPQDPAVVPNVFKFFCQNSAEILRNFSIFSDFSTENKWAPCAQAPGTPSALQNRCENLVAAVNFEIFWNGSAIANSTVEIFIENFELNSILEQKFSVNFFHSLSEPKNEIERKIPRSGNPGYDPGRPILAAFQTATGLDFDENRQIFFWKPNSSGKCAEIFYDRVNFRENSDAACFLSLGRQDFSNCERLRERIVEGLDKLIAADYVSKFGTVPALTKENFVPIFRQTLNFTESSTESPNRCQKIPVHIGFDILFSEAAVVNNSRIFEISGAYVYYNTTEWTLRNETENFFVTSSVRFFQNSAQTNPNVKSFYLKRLRDHCPSAISCWNELFFPFTKEISSYALGFGLSTIIFIIFLYFISKPWW